MKLIIIDPRQRTVAEEDVPATPRAYQAIVDGKIEVQAKLANGDNVWANEEGLLRPPYHWWSLYETPLVITGRAFLSGLRYDARQMGDVICQPKLRLHDFASSVEWLTTEQAREPWVVREAARRAQGAEAHRRFAEGMGVSADAVQRVFVESQFAV